jgi:dienelactone hydrolase
MKTNKDLEVIIPFNRSIYLNGILNVPADTQRMVIFVHGSGSGRLSPRNQKIANSLNNANFATLLFDLLTSDEDVLDEMTREYRFNIPLLISRLEATTNWVLSQPEFKRFNIGYFGASTGAAAALIAAAQNNNTIKAVVSRGGRADLAEEALPFVEAPTLLIVGGNDREVIKLNEIAMSAMRCINQLEIIPGATHLFEEPGKLDEVALLAIAWFERFL